MNYKSAEYKSIYLLYVNDTATNAFVELNDAIEQSKRYIITNTVAI